jgi:hypothetical protein
MDKQGFVNKLRLFLADPEGKIWNNAELDMLLDEALKQYCKDSGAFTGIFDFYPDDDGIYRYPDDYAGFMIGWNSDGKEITQATARELFFRSGKDMSKTGKPEYIFDDFSSYGDFSLYPVPENLQNRINISITPAFGEIIDDDYGVYLNDDYGTTLSVEEFTFTGNIVYRKVGRFEDVKDHMAIIYYALSLAYCADSEFANAELASYWQNMYRSRIAAFSRVKHDNSGRSIKGNFY